MGYNKIIFATKNKGKAEELKKLLTDNGIIVELYTLSDFSDIPNIVESGKTFLENAFIKAKTIFNKFKLPVIADDSGLVVEEIGEPGVYSSRYAGENATDEQNNKKLIEKVRKVKNRKAYFECSLVFIDKYGNTFETSGRCYGEIILSPKGDRGFGYDPIFYLPEFKKTMAEIDIETKNRISHRGKAFKSLAKELSKIFSSAERGVGIKN